VNSFRVQIAELKFKPPVTAGLNLFTLASMVPLLRNTCEDHDPILVGPPCKCCGVRVVLDGRHRVIATITAGRQDILAIEE
jgi:hypothetical protein